MSFGYGTPLSLASSWLEGGGESFCFLKADWRRSMADEDVLREEEEKMEIWLISVRAPLPHQSTK